MLLLPINYNLLSAEFHYRSGDPSLIAISNALFYNSRLVAPSCSPKYGDRDSHKGLKVVLVDGYIESDSGPPAGLINRSQASAIACDAKRIIIEADQTRKSLSLGIVTLNRPQRSLIMNLLLADSDARLEIDPLQNGSLRRRLDDSRDATILAHDKPLFIESIDRIQGEEREIILFSTLLTPRDTSESTIDQEKQNARDKSDIDPWDALEEIDSEESSSDEEENCQSVRRTRNRRKNTRHHHVRHYSTLTHAHGHRLLNVGITRAIVSLVCYIHSACPAPPPHDSRAGRRAFGWLVRALLGSESPCTCTTCQRLNEELSSMNPHVEQSSLFGHGNNNKTIEQKSEKLEEQNLVQSEDSLIFNNSNVRSVNSDSAIFSRAVCAWLRSVPQLVVIPVESSSQRASIDWCAINAKKERIAILCSPRSNNTHDWLDFYDAFPNALLHTKLGWDRMSRLQPSDILHWVAETDCNTLEISERLKVALSTIRKGMNEFIESTCKSSSNPVDIEEVVAPVTSNDTFDWLAREFSSFHIAEEQESLSCQNSKSKSYVEESFLLPSTACPVAQELSMRNNSEFDVEPSKPTYNALSSSNTESDIPVHIRREVKTPIVSRSVKPVPASQDDISTDDDFGSLSDFIVEEADEASAYSYYLSVDRPEEESPPFRGRHQEFQTYEENKLIIDKRNSVHNDDHVVLTESHHVFDVRYREEINSNPYVESTPRKPADSTFHQDNFPLTSLPPTTTTSTSKKARRQIQPIEDDY